MKSSVRNELLRGLHDESQQGVGVLSRTIVKLNERL